LGGCITALWAHQTEYTLFEGDFSPGEIMTSCCLHKSNIALMSFGVYCQVAENIQPRNSLAPRTRTAILVGNLNNLSGGQVFLGLDTGHTIIRHQWVALPMPHVVIDCVNLLGRCKPAMLTFTNQQGCDIGDSNPQDANSVGILDDNLIIIHPAMEIPGVDTTTYPAEYLQDWTLTLNRSGYGHQCVGHGHQCPS
jgi:hypothetical protein